MIVKSEFYTPQCITDLIKSMSNKNRVENMLSILKQNKYKALYKACEKMASEKGFNNILEFLESPVNEKDRNKFFNYIMDAIKSN